MIKNPPASAGDVGLISGSGRSPGEGNGNPLQYSHLGQPMVGGAWRATVHGVAKSQTRLSKQQQQTTPQLRAALAVSSLGLCPPAPRLPPSSAWNSPVYLSFTAYHLWKGTVGLAERRWLLRSCSALWTHTCHAAPLASGLSWPTRVAASRGRDFLLVCVAVAPHMVAST